MQIKGGGTSKQACKRVVRKKRTRKVCSGANGGELFKIEELVRGASADKESGTMKIEKVPVDLATRSFLP